MQVDPGRERRAAEHERAAAKADRRASVIDQRADVARERIQIAFDEGAVDGLVDRHAQEAKTHAAAEAMQRAAAARMRDHAEWHREAARRLRA